MTSYSLTTGTLALEHRVSGETHPVEALVDVNCVRASLGTDQTRFGEWVNVVGYITQTSGQKASSSAKQMVEVQATLVWSAGPLNLQTYELSVRALFDRQECP